MKKLKFLSPILTLLFVFLISTLTAQDNKTKQETDDNKQVPETKFEVFVDSVQRKMDQVDSEIARIEKQISDAFKDEQYKQAIRELDENQRELRRVVTQYNRAVEAGIEQESKELADKINILMDDIESDLKQLRNNTNQENSEEKSFPD
ncbi:MAG: hypothetical protein H0V01_02815 [Bacteroidetes bacterium]|nr:hypothetical protein [Bacteroidota bacterium]HET6244743.1 hypothetical protein [Bacteroidia bacterium]